MAFELTRTGIHADAIHWFASLDSTMHEAARLASAGSPSGTIVGADEQTSGQGRLGHSWHSEKEAGLYVSFILRLALAMTDLPVVTLALGLAAAEAIMKTTGLTCDLRWPNDVLVSGRKCCGILAQLHGAAIVAGIGINVNHSEFPADLKDIATSLLLESGAPQSRETLLGHLATAVQTYARLLTEEGKDAIFRLFEHSSSYVRGRRVVVDGTIKGTTAGLDPNGFLILRKDDGTSTLILAGGVRPLA